MRLSGYKICPFCKSYLEAQTIIRTYRTRLKETPDNIRLTVHDLELDYDPPIEILSIRCPKCLAEWDSLRTLNAVMSLKDTGMPDSVLKKLRNEIQIKEFNLD